MVASKVTLFDEYRIESRGNNEIYLEIGLEPLSKALRSAEMAGTTGRDSEAGVKLSKKNDKAVLVFDIVGQASRVIRFVIVTGLKKLTLFITGTL